MATIFGQIGGTTETLTGSSGNDVIDGEGGSDWIDGGAGNDSALFFADRAYFSVFPLDPASL